MSEDTERDAGSQRAAARVGGERHGSTSHRAIRDVPSLQALAHPTRLALLEAIGLTGAMTATQASAAVGESPTACAYHLRMLGRLGFVEEAGGGRGRQRPWRLVPAGVSFDEDSDDPAVAAAAGALSQVLLEKFIANIRRFALARPSYPREVREATDTVQLAVHLTPHEAGRLRDELIAVLTRHAHLERLGDAAQRPAGSYPFEIIAFTHVLNVPGLTPGAIGAQPPPPPQRTDLPARRRRLIPG
jgi:DNA-binding transcriptional ArsR family regulator